MNRALLSILAALAAVLMNECITAPSFAQGPTLRFANSGVTYDIPRVYLTWPSSPQQPDLAVTFPEFGPASEAKDCETWMVSDLHHRCSTFDFLISGGRGPTRRQTAENSHRLLPDTLWATSTDEYGFQIYYSKNNPSLVNFTRDENGDFLYFFCNMLTRPDGSRDGVCSDIVFLSDGNSASVLFPYHLRNQLPEIETGIDNLMRRFRTPPGGPTAQS